MNSKFRDPVEWMASKDFLPAIEPLHPAGAGAGAVDLEKLLKFDPVYGGVYKSNASGSGSGAGAADRASDYGKWSTDREARDRAPDTLSPKSTDESTLKYKFDTSMAFALVALLVLAILFIFVR